jgi:hypothetical protein
LGDTLLALRRLIVVVSLLPSALVSPPRRSRRSLFIYLLFVSHLPRNCFFLPFACLPIQEAETHPVLLPREIEMLHSGKRWVTDWKHWNYTAAIKATEVRFSFVLTFSFEIWSGGFLRARREVEIVDRREGTAERWGRDGDARHAPVHLEPALLRERRDRGRELMGVHPKLARVTRSLYRYLCPPPLRLVKLSDADGIVLPGYA